MKFGLGEIVILLTTDYKPTSGKAVVVAVNNLRSTYSIKYQGNDNDPDVIMNVPEDRIIQLNDTSN